MLTVQQHVCKETLAICYVGASCSLVFNTRCFRLQGLQNEEATVQSHNHATEDLPSREAEGQVEKKSIKDPTSHDRQTNVVTLQSPSKGRIGRSRVRIAVSETSVILQVPLSYTARLL